MGPKDEPLVAKIVQIGPNRREQSAKMLIAARRFPGLLAISGADGSTLWWHRNELEVAAADGHLRRGFTLGRPLVTTVDDDDVPDVVMGVMFQRQQYLSEDEQRVELPAETRVQAVSGRTGRLIWNEQIADALTQGDPVQSINNVPYDSTWFSLTPCDHRSRRGASTPSLRHGSSTSSARTCLSSAPVLIGS